MSALKLMKISMHEMIDTLFRKSRYISINAQEIDKSAETMEIRYSLRKFCFNLYLDCNESSIVALYTIL